MIEGIIGLFVILFIGAIAPYIKYWYQQLYKTEEHRTEAKPPENPKEGDIWLW